MTNLLTTKAVAELLGLSPATIRRYTKQGKLPCHRINCRTLRYNHEDITHLAVRHNDAASNTVKPTAGDAEDQGGVQ